MYVVCCDLIGMPHNPISTKDTGQGYYNLIVFRMVQRVYERYEMVRNRYVSVQVCTENYTCNDIEEVEDL